MDDTPTIVIDNGSGHMKAGLAGTDAPQCVFPAVVGRPKLQKNFGAEGEELFVGSEAMSKRGVLSISYPIEHGIVTNWDDMERVWSHTMHSELRVDPTEHSVMVTDAPFNPKKNREKIIELLFEKFDVLATYVVVQAVMSLYATGRVSGAVVDSGDGVTHTVPIYEGFALPHAIQRLNLAGRDVTDYLTRILSERGHSMTTSSEKDIVREIKETECYVAQDFDEELKKAKTDPEMQKEFTLPDGNVVQICDERFRAPEILFDPIMCGKEAMGVHELTFTCINKCDIDLRTTLYNNVILSGGTTMYDGFQARMLSELQARAPGGRKSVKVIAPENRRYIVWQGASIVTQLAQFHDMLIWRKEYDEVGSDIVHRKCF